MITATVPEVARMPRRCVDTLRRCVRAVLSVIAVSMLSGCADDAPVAQRPEYSRADAVPQLRRLSFGVHPLHNPGRLMTLYGPIVEALNEALPDVVIRLEASRDYADYERKLRERTLDLALPNPYQTVSVAAPAYRVFGKVSGDEDFHGLILRRRDSPIRQPLDLRGATFSCPARTAVAACMLPLLHLREAGLDVARQLDVRTVGSQESSILNVARGLVDAGATWPPPWRAFQKDYPGLAAQLEVAWVTDNLPNNSLMARADLEPELVERVAQFLFGLAATEEGRRLLVNAEIAGFEPATDARYAPVQAMLARYAELIGPIGP